MKKNKHNLWQSELQKIPHQRVATVIDVGVMEGTFDIYDRFDRADLILIDALKESRHAVGPRLVNRKWTYHDCAVGSCEGETEINVNANPRESSILGRTNDAVITEKRTVKIRTLDNILDPGMRSPALLKIDTEGYELEVLRGATRTITQCNYIICETSVIQRFHDSYRFEDMILFMRENGFRLRCILNAPNWLRCLDILFERERLI